MRHGQHVHEATPTIEAPGVLPDATDQVKGILDNYSMRVPESVRSAQEGAQLLVAEASQVTPDNTAGGGYKYAGTSSVRAEAAEQLLSVAERGIDYWRLTPAEKEGWQKVLDASHPSQVPPELKQVLRAVKPDVMMPDAMALSILKQKQAGPRIKLAEQIEEKDRIETSKAEYRARGEQQASQWTASVERGRSLRERADKRVEGILYKLKLENGGEIAFSKNPGLRERLRQQAVVMAETEGHRTGHLKKRHYEVPEAHSTTQQETVNALREFWSASSKKAEAQAAPVIEGNGQDLESTVRRLYGRDSSLEAWDNMSQEDRDKAVARALVAARRNASYVSDEEWALKTPREKLDYYVSSAEDLRIAAWAGSVRYTGDVNNSRVPAADRGKVRGLREMARGRRAKVVGAVVVGLAVFGAGLGIYRAVEGNDSVGKGIEVVENGSDKPASGLDGLVKDPEVRLESVVVEKGENPWTITRDYLRELGIENPTDAQIWAIDKMLCAENGIDIQAGQDRNISVGTSLDLPSPESVHNTIG